MVEILSKRSNSPRCWVSIFDFFCLPATYLPPATSPNPATVSVSFQQTRAEFKVLEEEHEAKNEEISTRGHTALADFMTGASDLKSPARMHTLATVMEESSPTSSTTSELLGYN